MPYQANKAHRQKFPKAQYRVKNWREYDQALQERGSLTVWVMPEAIYLYDKHYGAVDPYARGFQLRKVNFRVGLCEDLVDETALRRTSFYNEFARYFDVFYLCWIALASPTQHLTLSLVRSEKRQPFGSSQLELLTLLTPHVEQAISLNRRLSSLANEAAAAKKSVEAFTLAVLALDGNGYVIAFSSRAEALLQQESGIRLRNRQIALDDPIAHARFRTLLAGVLRTAAGRGLDHAVLARESQVTGRAHLEVPTPPRGGAVLVRRSKEPSTVQVMVYPFYSDSVLQDDKPSALVFLSEPAPVVGGHEKELRELYGLTGAEARLAVLIGTAVPLLQAAERLHITVSTARDRLKLRWTRLVGQKIEVDLRRKRGHVRGGFSTASPDLRRRSSSIPGELYPPRKHFYFRQSTKFCKSKISQSGRKRKSQRVWGTASPSRIMTSSLCVCAGTNLPAFGS